MTQELENSKKELLNGFSIKAGETIYTNMRHVTPSGMTRYYDLYIMRDNRPVNITWHVSILTGWKFDRNRHALKVTGCGMDMGFHTVYTLSNILFPDGFKVDGVGRNGDTSGHDNDGGYALKESRL